VEAMGALYLESPWGEYGIHPYDLIFYFDLKRQVHNDGGKPHNSTKLSIYRLLKAGNKIVL
jgi:hypothetical protein